MPFKAPLKPKQVFGRENLLRNITELRQVNPISDNEHRQRLIANYREQLADVPEDLSQLSRSRRIAIEASRKELQELEVAELRFQERKEFVHSALYDIEKVIIESKDESDFKERFDELLEKYRGKLDLGQLLSYVLSSSSQYRERFEELYSSEEQKISTSGNVTKKNNPKLEITLLKFERQLHFDERYYALRFLRNSFLRLLMKLKTLPYENKTKVLDLFDKIDWFLYENELFEAKYSSPDRNRQLRNLNFSLKNIIANKNSLMIDRLLKFLPDIEKLLKEFNLEPSEFKPPMKPLIKISDSEFNMLINSINNPRSLNVLSEIVSRDLEHLGYNYKRSDLNQGLYDAAINLRKEYFAMSSNQRRKLSYYKLFIKLVFKYLKNYRNIDTKGKGRVERGAIRLNKGYDDYIPDPKTVGEDWESYRRPYPWEHVSIRTAIDAENDYVRRYVDTALRRNYRLDFDMLLNLKNVEEKVLAEELLRYILSAPENLFYKSMNRDKKNVTSRQRYTNIIKLLDKYGLIEKYRKYLEKRLSLPKKVPEYPIKLDQDEIKRIRSIIRNRG